MFIEFIEYCWEVENFKPPRPLIYKEVKVCVHIDYESSTEGFQVPHQGNIVDCGWHMLSWIEGLLYADALPGLVDDDVSETFAGITAAKGSQMAGYRAHLLHEVYRFLKHNYTEVIDVDLDE